MSEFEIEVQKRLYTVQVPAFMLELIGNRCTVTTAGQRFNITNARLLHEALGEMLEVQEEEGER